MSRRCRVLALSSLDSGRFRIPYTVLSGSCEPGAPAGREAAPCTRDTKTSDPRCRTARKSSRSSEDLRDPIEAREPSGFASVHGESGRARTRRAHASSSIRSSTHHASALPWDAVSFLSRARLSPKGPGLPHSSTRERGEEFGDVVGEDARLLECGKVTATRERAPAHDVECALGQ